MTSLFGASASLFVGTAVKVGSLLSLSRWAEWTDCRRPRDLCTKQKCVVLHIFAHILDQIQHQIAANQQILHFRFSVSPLFLVSNLLQIPQMLARFKVPSPMRWDEVGDNINKHQKLSKTYQTCIFTLLIFVLPQARYSISGLDYRNLTGCDSECFFKHSFFHMTLWINWGG